LNSNFISSWQNSYLFIPITLAAASISTKPSAVFSSSIKNQEAIIQEITHSNSSQILFS